MWKRNTVKKSACDVADEEWCDSFSDDEETSRSGSSTSSVHITANVDQDVTAELWIERLRKVGIPVEEQEFDKKFEEIGKLGRGAYGFVCMVKEKATGRNYAIKRVDVPLNPNWLRYSGDNFSSTSSPEFSPPPSSPDLSPSLVRASSSSTSYSSYPPSPEERRDPILDKLAPRLLREVHAMASLGHHRHLVRFHNSWLEIGPFDGKVDKHTEPCVFEESSEFSEFSEFSDIIETMSGTHPFESLKNKARTSSSLNSSSDSTDDKAKQHSPSLSKSDETSRTSTCCLTSSMDYNNWDSTREQLIKSTNFIHPNIAPLPPSHQLTLFIQMELCSSDSLHSWLRSPEREFVDRKLSLKLFSQLLSALSHIHEKGFFHRDIKPDNLLIVYDTRNRKPSLKLADFGLSKPLPEFSPESDFEKPSPLDLHGATVEDCEDEEKEEEKEECEIEVNSLGSNPIMDLVRHTQGRGTAMYMAPEVWNGGSYDEKVDVYAAGIVLFELFNCFTTGSERIISITKLKDDRVVDECFRKEYPEVARLVLAMTHPDPTLRPRAIDILSHPAFAAFEFADAKRIIVESDGEHETLVTVATGE